MKFHRFFLKLYLDIKTLEWKLISRLNPNFIKTFVLPEQSLFDYPLNSALGCCLYRGSFEKHELNFFMSSLKEGDIFLDVGANGGLYSVIASKKVGSTGHVYAFEPGKFELNLLARNIALNSCKNITVVDKAVGNTSGTVDFGISHDGAMNSLRKTNHSLQSIKEWRLVNMTSLDDFIQQVGIQKVDFIKIDVEGAEDLVFQGAEKLLKSNHRLTILFEGSDTTSSSFGYSVRDLIDRVKNLGFSVYHFDNNGGLVRVIESTPHIGSKLYNFIAQNW